MPSLSLAEEQKLFGLLGLAKRAGRLVSGSTAVLQAFNEHRVRGLILADDASVATQKKYEQITLAAGVPLYRALSRDVLGSALGKEAPQAAVALLDGGFWQSVVKILNKN